MKELGIEVIRIVREVLITCLVILKGGKNPDKN
ncbi:hypothetical protein CLV81_2367 [Flagellimonas meridianipacifica]|uniref:Uncharacterized protein n=1 Tax=Flagellimonas meridianipacifica TaxID=1080225 RepID=A0A2T0M8Z5_9FLAO|nr:hypothetical protein CLV81_2367 [Allomuricauda pacifica]